MAVWLGTFKLDCRRCSEQEKIQNGCVEDSPIPGVWKLYDWEFQRCPLKLITYQSSEFLKAYKFYLKGYLPNPGGWLEQSIIFIKAIEIIEREIEKIKDRKPKVK